MRKKVELSFFMDNMTLCLKDPKDSSIRVVELINTSNKVIGVKINKQYLVALLNTNNELIEKKSEKQYYS
jgi:hypothetical protein